MIKFQSIFIHERDRGRELGRERERKRERENKDG
jgi:hypothetical protein